MDFCQLLHKAKKNDEDSPKTVKYYSTKYEPPKKIQKKNKDLSENIKKFLAKKEAEEQKKLEEEQRKKEELLALRSQDKKATRRVNVMIKRTKSANQSVIADAIDQNHTAITRAGAEQPDEDDYGYVSQESAALYEKMMAKYSLIPDEPKFDPFKKKVSLNLNRTREKVKAALEKEREDALHPRKRRKKTQTEDAGESGYEEKIEKEKKGIKIKAKPKPGPPPLSFMELLKIAEKKQHEPIVIEEKPQEEEKLYTKKQKKEMEKDREEKERRERRANDMEVKDRNNDDNKDKKPKICSNNSVDSKTIEKPIIVKPLDKNLKDKEKVQSKPEKSTNSAFRDMHGSVPVKNGVSSKFSEKQPLKSLSNSTLGNNKLSNNKPIGKSKEFPPRDLISKSKNVPTRDNRLPPPNVKGINRKEPIKINKGRILDDDDDEDEYDSELDDFIDDEPQEGDYSNYIKEIFGYDRSRYKDVDEDVDNMESSFAQQMKEEVISAKIGIMEDLEDIKKEENEKRQKMLLKKKMMRR